MKIPYFRRQSLTPLLLTLLALCQLQLPALASADPVEPVPPKTCGTGWKMDGKPLRYDRDSLSDRINGEAELYFTYGFERMIAARYTHNKNTAVGMDVEVYRMGSLLDAFGMYANYRQKDGRTLAVGVEANLSSAQLFFYQDRYFVHIQLTGTDAIDSATLSACAEKVVAHLPGDRTRPAELSAFDRPEIVTGSERYLPQSLLGYDFLNKGIMAEVTLAGKELQIFFLLGTTAESAARSFERYRSQLVQRKIESGAKNALFLEGIDPLYGPVVILNKGACLAGAVKISERQGLRSFLETLCK
jgi:hypothetical protein